MADSHLLTVDHLSTRDLTRIFSRIVVSPITGCWVWTGPAIPLVGYGRLRHQGRSELIHRVLYAWLVEPLPRGRGRGVPVLDHLQCDFPPCCNPTHLRLVSNRDNCLRARVGPIVDNAKKSHCVNGHLLPVMKNDRRARKRYCLPCAIAGSATRRNDPAQREHILEYFRHYNEARMNGPRRTELLERGRIAQARFRGRAKKAASG